MIKEILDQDFEDPNYDPRTAAIQITKALAPELPETPTGNPGTLSQQEVRGVVELMLIYAEIAKL